MCCEAASGNFGFDFHVNHLRFTWQGMFMDRVLVRFVKRVVNSFQDKFTKVILTSTQSTRV